MMYVLGVAFCGVFIWGGITGPVETARSESPLLGVFLLGSWLTTNERVMFAADRWRRPRAYAALFASLIVVAVCITWFAVRAS